MAHLLERKIDEITSSEVQRSYGKFSERARTRAQVVTRNGNPIFYTITPEQYQEMLNFWPMFDEYRRLRIITEEEPEDEFQRFLQEARPSEAEIAAGRWADED